MLSPRLNTVCDTTAFSRATAGSSRIFEVAFRGFLRISGLKEDPIYARTAPVCWPMSNCRRRATQPASHLMREPSGMGAAGRLPEVIMI